MKWLVIIGGAVAGLAALVIIVGAFLPRDHVATVAARILAPPDEVWRTITTPEEFPRWRPDVARVDMLAPGPNGPSWREHSRHGAITMVVDVAEPPHHLIARIADDHLPFGGYWDYRVEPDGAGASRVTVSEHGWVSNPLFRFVSRYVMGHTGSLEQYLRALGKKYGAETTPTVAGP